MNNHDYNHPAYINIPYFVLQDEKLDAFNKILFSLFWSFSVSGRKIKMSNGYLSTLLKLDIKSIGKRIKDIESMGYIKRSVRKYKRVIEVTHIPYVEIDIDDDPSIMKLVENSTDIEHPPLPSVPSTKDTHPPLTSGTPLRSPAVPPPLPSGEDIKAYNKEDIKEKPTPKKIAPAKAEVDNSFLMTLEDALKDNPYNIPSQMLAEWLLIRKKRKCPLTHTTWNRTLKVLTKLVNSGLDAIDCFERMVANGWQGMEVRYFEQEMKLTTVKSKADIDKEIRARELKAQEMKRQEMEASKGIVRDLTQITGFSESKAAYLQERERLGMNALELHEYNMKMHREKMKAGG